MHPRNFDSHLTGRPPDRPSAPLAHQYKIIQSSGMATQMQLEVLVQGNRMAAGLLEREKKQQQIRVFFDVIFDVYIHVDNRERAKASDWKQRRKISLEEKHENFMAEVRKWEMLEASKVKMSGSEKIKVNMNTETKSLVSIYDNSSIKIMSN